MQGISSSVAFGNLSVAGLLVRSLSVLRILAPLSRYREIGGSDAVVLRGVRAIDIFSAFL